MNRVSAFFLRLLERWAESVVITVPAANCCSTPADTAGDVELTDRQKEDLRRARDYLVLIAPCC
jgi:hypothetical protein